MDGSILAISDGSGHTWEFDNMTLPAPGDVRRQLGMLPKSLSPEDVEEWLAS